MRWVQFDLLAISGEASPTFGHANANFSVFIDRIKPVFHSFISLPRAKNYDSKIIFLCPFAAKEISSGPPIVENVLLLLHLLFMELQNN